MPKISMGDLANDMRKLAQNAEKLDGKQSVSMIDLLTPAFLAKSTRFADLDRFFAVGNFTFESAEDFKAIPREKLDAFVAIESKFATWDEMVSRAGAEWAERQIFKGL